MLHISSRETREWMNEQIDYRLHKQGLINIDSRPEDIRADMIYLRRWRQMMKQIRRSILSAIIKASIGALLGFISWALITFIGEVR